MSQASFLSLIEHPAFCGLSEASISTLESDCSVLRFDLGGQLCEPDEITARILVILQGQIRLVGRHNGRLTTVGKFGPGSVVGAASLLSGAPCENVIAAEEVIAYAITDQYWRELYSREATFREWCNQQLWPQELLKLLEVLEQNNPEADSSALEKLEDALQLAERCPPDKAAVEAALDSGKLLYVTSAWGDLTIGQPIRSSTGLPSCEPFALRLVSLPASFGAQLSQEVPENIPDVLFSGASIQEAEVLPPVSSFSPERNVVNRLSLVRADGH